VESAATAVRVSGWHFVLLKVLSMVLDNDSCLDWRNVKKGAAEMTAEGPIVLVRF
jgi:hypothetical protein